MTTDVLLILGAIFVWAAAALLGVICFFSKKPKSSQSQSHAQLLPVGIADWEDIVADCPSGVARPAKQPEFQLVLHQG